MGSEMLVFTTINGSEIAAKADPNLNISREQEIVLDAEMDRMHLVLEDGQVVQTTAH